MARDQKPIVVKKVVKKGHGGHHGGSWKVAYADFVTAMMAFFMVMWILGMDDETRQSIEVYFSGQPVGVQQGFSAGSNPLLQGGAVPIGPLYAARQAQVQQFESVERQIRTRMRASDGLDEIEAMVEIVITDQGMRIELIEGADGNTFFDLGSAVLQPAARRALQIIGSELGQISAPIVLEGHTDSARYGAEGYTNWELSADRANAARRALQLAGVTPSRVVEIRGHADRLLRVAGNPLDPSNRRIAILLPFTAPSSLPQEPAAKPAIGTT